MTIKLSLRDREVLSIAQLKANSTVSELKPLCRYQEHSIRYAIDRALDRGIIVPRCFVNLNRLGFNQYEVYFSLSSEKKDKRKALLNSLIDSKHVSWLGQLGGDFQYGLNLAANNIKEVSDLFSSLSEKFGSLFLEKVFAERISFKYFGNKYLSNSVRKQRYLSYDATTQLVSVDDLDRQILSAVIQLGRGSSRTLSRELSLPQTTIDYRLRKLEKSGVIVGYYYELQAQELGMQSYILLICLKSISAPIQKAFNEFCSQHPMVVVLIQCLGSWDYEVVVDAQNALEVTKLVEEIYDRFGTQTTWIKILPAFRNLKVKEYPF